MGKVRRLRQKYHLSKVGQAKTAKDEAERSDETKSGDVNAMELSFPLTENIFKEVDITYDTLTKCLPQKEFDTRSIASTKSRKELKLEEQHLKKKVKIKLRRERFLQKLDVTQQAIKAAKEKKKKCKRPINGDLNQLIEALPSLQSLIATKCKKESKERKKPKLKGILKQGKRIKQQTSDAKLMKKIVRDEKFKSNPGKTIIEFLKEKVALGR